MTRFRSRKPAKLYHDTALMGFGLCVGKTCKAYFVQQDISGRTIRTKIGRHGVFTTELARREARRLLNEIARGINPADQKKAAAAKSVTLNEVFKEYLTHRTLNPRTIEDYRNIINLAFNGWLNKPLISINKDAISQRHHELGDQHGKSYANYAMRVLRALFNFAMAQYEDAKGQSLILENPVKRLSQPRSWYKDGRRQRTIKDYQLPQWYEAVMALDDTDYRQMGGTVRDYLLLMLFTGLRRQEAARLKWSDIDFHDKTLTVHQTKNQEALTLPLSTYLYDLLNKRQQDTKSEYVFPGTGKHGHLIEPGRQVQKVIEMSGVEFSIHDLRRTYASIAQSIEIPYLALKTLLNHKMTDVTAHHYVVISVDQLRDPVQRIADQILSLINR